MNRVIIAIMISGPFFIFLSFSFILLFIIINCHFLPALCRKHKACSRNRKTSALRMFFGLFLLLDLFGNYPRRRKRKFSRRTSAEKRLKYIKYSRVFPLRPTQNFLVYPLALNSRTGLLLKIARPLALIKDFARDFYFTQRPRLPETNLPAINGGCATPTAPSHLEVN